MGSERTFGENIQHRAQMLEILCQLADELLAMLAERKLCSSTLTIKVRFADFETLTRAHSHRQGALDEFSVHQTLPFLLDRALADRQESERVEPRVGKRFGVRLLGVSFSGLSPDVGRRLQQLEMTF